MFYRRRASPKHRYNIIEEDYGGGRHRTRLIDLKDQLLLSLGCLPAPIYIGASGKAAGLWRRRTKGGVLLPPGVGLLLSLLEKKRGGEGEGKGGPAPLSNSDQRGSAGLLPFDLSPLFPYGPIRLVYSPANSHNSPVLKKIPESLETFPNSEYSRPIYRSLHPDHFETPRHVPDLIRDSELLQYIKTHKLII